MTLFGKLLVLVNLAFAVMLAAWSFSIYANGIDWTDSKGTASAPKGEFAKRAAVLDGLWKGVAPAQDNWLSGRDKLANEETHLAAEYVWYDKEIRYVLVGPAKAKGIAEVAVAAKDDAKTGVMKGQILLDDKGYPRMGNPLPLQSLAEYNKENEGLLQSLKDVMAKHEMRIEESNKLTDLIIGDKSKGIRGLQQRIYDEKAKNADVLAEMKLVEPQYINTLVEAQLINKRHAQMVKRIEELKKIKVAGK